MGSTGIKTILKGGENHGYRNNTEHCMMIALSFLIPLGYIVRQVLNADK